MKFSTCILLVAMIAIAPKTFAQKNSGEIKVGHLFYVSLPDFMERTVGLNSAASIQFISNENDVAGFIIEDSKAELKLAETNFATLKDFYQFFEKDFLTGLDKRTISTPVEYQENGKNYIEFDASYLDKDMNTEINYYVCLIESRDYYYKVLCWSTADKKDKFRPGFKNIALSIRD